MNHVGAGKAKAAVHYAVLKQQLDTLKGGRPEGDEQRADQDLQDYVDGLEQASEQR